MSDNERLKKIKKLKERLLDAYIIDGVIVGKTRDEIEGLIEEKATQMYERLRRFEQLIKEMAESKGAESAQIIIPDLENKWKLKITCKGEEDGLDLNEFILTLELRTEEFAEQALANPYLRS